MAVVVVVGGFLNNASCQWSNKDKINPPAERLKPFSDYFHICVLVVGLGQSDVQLMRFTHAGCTRPARPSVSCSPHSRFRFSSVNYCASSSSTSVFCGRRELASTQRVHGHVRTCVLLLKEDICHIQRTSFFLN